MSRQLRLALAAILFLGLALCLAGLIFLLSAYPVWRRPAPAATAVSWPHLPQPTLAYPGWSSFTHPQTIPQIARHQGLLWAATDGGVVVWNWQTGAAAHFTSEHGLAENDVTSLAVGLDGALWFGSATAGLSRFDGRQWQTFTTGDGLPGNQVRDVAVTDDGFVWAATDGGVGQYDGRRWYRYDRVRSFLQLPGEDIGALAVAPDGLTLWAATDQGAARYNGRRWETQIPAGSRSLLNMRDIAITPDGKVWFATAGGLLRTDGRDWELFTSGDGLEVDDLLAVTAVPDNTVWVRYANPADGLTLFDATTAIPRATHRPADTAQRITPAAEGTYYHEENGLRLVAPGGSTRFFPLPVSLPLPHVSGLAAAAEVWAAGPGGVSRYDGHAWTTYTTTHGLPGTAVTALTVDGVGRPWVAVQGSTPATAVFEPERQSWQARHCPIAGPPSALVRGGVQTGDGWVWFATSNGVARSDGHSWQLFTTADGLPGDNIQAIAATGQDEVWVGTDQGRAVWLGGRWYPTSSDDTLALTTGPGDELWYFNDSGLFHRHTLSQTRFTAVSTPPVSQVYDFLATADAFWMSTAEGVHRLPRQAVPAGDRWQRFTRTDGLATDVVTALAQADDGAIWAAGSTEPTSASSNLYGTYQVQHTYLSRYDGRGWQTGVLPLAGGLLHPVVTDLLLAPDGDLWVASLGGLSRFDGDHWTAFPPGLGPPAAEVYRLAFALDSVWAVTAVGLTRFQAPEGWQRWASLDDWQPLWSEVKLASDPGGGLWVGSENRLFRFDGTAWQPVPVEAPADPFTLRALAFDGEGQLWLSGYAPAPPGAQTHFLGRMADGRVQWQPLPTGGGFFAVDLMRFGPDGRLWLGNDNGLWLAENPGSSQVRLSPLAGTRSPTDLLFTAAGRPWMTQKQVPAVTDPQTGTAVAIPLPEAGHGYALAAAADGTIWVGTDRGLARRRADESWELVPVPGEVGDRRITRLQPMADGTLWLGTFAGEVLRFADGQTIRFLHGPDRNRDAPVSALLPEGEGSVWVARFGGGISRLQDGRETRFPESGNLYRVSVDSLAVDGQGVAWLATDTGLLGMEMAHGAGCGFVGVGDTGQAWQAVVAGDGDQVWAVQGNTFWRWDGAAFSRAGALVRPVTAVAPDGAVWVAGEEAMVRHAGGRRQTLPLDELPGAITALAVAPDNSLWLGTTNGVVWFDGRDWHHFTAADGLAGNHIRQIAIAADGAIWFNSSGGISRLASLGGP